MKTVPVIETRNASRSYTMGSTIVNALQNVNLEIMPGEMLSIMGPSGSGKSTLMNLIGCLDTPSSGTVLLDGNDLSQASDEEMALLRNQKIGFVFQQFNLLPYCSILDNVATPLLYAGVPPKMREERAAELLKQVGLGNRLKHRPQELSGGQKQRVAIARALVNNPSLLLADEPTGALDQETGHKILELFNELHAAGNTLVLVTHDPKIANFTPRCIHILDGKIQHEKLLDGKLLDEGAEK